MTATVTQLHPAAQPDPAGAVTAPELCAQAGITYRQLDFWVRTGRLRTIGEPAPGYGYARGFTSAEVGYARTVRLLLEAGFHLDDACTLARRITDQPGAPIVLAGGLVTIDFTKETHAHHH